MSSEELAAPRSCSVCGKDMRDPDTGTAVMGISISVGVATDLWEALEATARQFGPYWKGNETCYEICYECWLRSLGVKPPQGQ